ncbi:hypothetical protein V8J88_10345 [Massilia sp. W12]|uniref:hypothetical protein n=1 Tax=Massilia sp. W12 TaxID=3126507 RepID=UPI0030CB468A
MFVKLNKKVAVFLLALGASASLAWAYPPGQYYCCKADCRDAYPNGGSAYNACMSDCLQRGGCLQ